MAKERCGAWFSSDRQYRYLLWRSWLEVGPARWLLIVGLNPSTADEETDDPTVRRCVGFAKRLGYTGVQITNLFAYRATTPAEMRAQADPVGPRNDYVLCKAIQDCDLVVAAWGTHGAYRDRHRAVVELLALDSERVMCFGRTKDGYPRHPLYLSNDTPLQPYFLREALRG